MKLEAEVIVTDGECVPSLRSLMKNERNPFLSKEFILLEESKMRKDENTTFVCKNCSTPVAPLTNGSYRNHCPQCLYSLHVDIRPGDRQNTCHGLMRPIDYRQHSKKAISCCMNALAAKTSSGISWHRIRNSQTILLSGWLKPLRITKKPKKTMLKAGLFCLSEQRTPYTTNCS